MSVRERLERARLLLLVRRAHVARLRAVVADLEAHVAEVEVRVARLERRNEAASSSYWDRRVDLIREMQS